MVLVWWILLAWTFHYSHMNKLHLLWLGPSVVLVSLLISRIIVIGVRLAQAFDWVSAEEPLLPFGIERYSSIGMWSLIAIYLGILRGMTF